MNKPISLNVRMINERKQSIRKKKSDMANFKREKDDTRIRYHLHNCTYNCMYIVAIVVCAYLLVLCENRWELKQNNRE